jgi:hypothetical protein
MNAPNNAEMKVPIKAAIPGYTTILLENGDTLVVQVVVQEAKLALGQKDDHGNPVYNITSQHSVAVIPGGARTTDGTNTTANADGRNSEQPG